MSEAGVEPAQLRRRAFIYVRQSSPTPVERNRESTQRQYALVDRAHGLGWSSERVEVIDEDLGRSAASSGTRTGFTRLTAEVALGQAGIVLGLEASRLARNNADWYRLLDLCTLTDTLIGDEDGIYDPRRHNDRILLGLLCEALHNLVPHIRAQGNSQRGGAAHPAGAPARGHPLQGRPRRTAPAAARRPGVGRARGRKSCSIPTKRSPAPCATSSNASPCWDRCAACGSGSSSTSCPSPPAGTTGTCAGCPPPTTRSPASLAHPAYAGAYVYGRTRTECYLDKHGQMRKRLRRLPRAQWRVLIPNHHRGYIDWQTFEANRARIDSNIRPLPNAAGGSVREGSAPAAGTGPVRPLRAAPAHPLPRQEQLPQLSLPGAAADGRPRALLSLDRRRAD